MNKPATAAPPPAIYVNFMQVASNQAEFSLAFGQLVQGETAQGHLASRLVTSPLHAKAMLAALTEAIERHEGRFGEIPELARPVESPAGAAASDRPAKAGRVPKRAQRRK